MYRNSIRHKLVTRHFLKILKSKYFDKIKNFKLKIIIKWNIAIHSVYYKIINIKMMNIIRKSTRKTVENKLYNLKCVHDISLFLTDFSLDYWLD